MPAEPSAVEPVEPENDDLSSKTAEPDPDWTPTEDPNATVVPGEMRSDREEIPAPFTKEDADKAETLEARSHMSRAVQSCQYYWPSPHAVCGVIRDKYNSLGGPASFLSFPNSPEYTNPDGYGKRTQFLNGPIHWSAATGAHPVVNSFLNRWGLNNYEAGRLKYPTTDEIVLPDGGRRQEFQQGVIYVAFQNAVGSALLNGPLRDKYNTVGGLTPGSSFLGYPIQDQIAPLPDGQGQMARFQNGVIYWHPAAGAHEITSYTLTTWQAEGYESGKFGYPISSSTLSGDKLVQNFQNGYITQTDPSQLLPWVDVEGFTNDGFGGGGGKWCEPGYFGYADFENVQENLDFRLPRNALVWQVADDNAVWDEWCRVTRSQASIRYTTDNNTTTTSIAPGPRYDLDDGTICYFRLESRSGGYTIDFNVRGEGKQIWKVHVAQ